MNAKTILAAIAAVCCVQGIAAASLVKPLPFLEVEDDQDALEFDLGQVDLTKFDFENMDVETILDNMVNALEEIRDKSLQSNNKLRAPRNIVSCVIAVTSVVKEAKEVTKLVGEFSQIKKDRADAQEKCKTPSENETVEECNKKAEEAYRVAHDKAKAEILPTVFKSLTTLFSLKACLSIL
ncbi:Alpha-glucan water dikinase, chloroplastic [Frankliniella fusca]|uniref:Alpha-glucan water dikinase, chloroplastic n=1 Tax=Frankliniella fusca TaxID=407009 RepID=A0AAE1HEQ7_9NEOP|nr:Alpha-glucan water dikinase, chloroplastic [Frankliniella fusca]